MVWTWVNSLQKLFFSVLSRLWRKRSRKKKSHKKKTPFSVSKRTLFQVCIVKASSICAVQSYSRCFLGCSGFDWRHLSAEGNWPKYFTVMKQRHFQNLWNAVCLFIWSRSIVFQVWIVVQNLKRVFFTSKQLSFFST